MYPVNTLTRRRLLQATAALPATRVQAARADDRPNILFLFADDWGRFAGVYQDPKRPSLSDVVRTPHIDRIANEGVRFTRAFMSTPSCTPSRASVATGCYSFRTGSAANLRGGSWAETKTANPGARLQGFGKLLEAGGYLVRDSYKTLAPPWLGGKKLAREFLRYSLYLLEAGGEGKAERARRHEAFVAQARDGIRQVLRDRQRPGQPFCYTFGPIHTHRPWVWQSGTKLWGIDPDSLRGKLPAFLPDNEVVRQDVADYLGEVQAIDLLAGAFLEELEKAGELERTMVVLAGDNGIPGMPRGKCNLYDFGVEAPLLVRWPGHGKAGRSVSDFVNLMDLAPTFLEAAGVARPDSMNGRSLVPLLASEKSGQIDRTRDFVVTSRERHVPDARAGNLPYPSRAIRTADYLYIRNFHPDRWPMGDPFGLTESGANEASYETLADYAVQSQYAFRDCDASPTKAWLITRRKDTEVRRFFDYAFSKRPGEELYDLRKDPDQLRNVAAESGYRKVRQQLSERMMGVLRQAADPRLNNDAFDRPPYVELL